MMRRIPWPPGRFSRVLCPEIGDIKRASLHVSAQPQEVENPDESLGPGRTHLSISRQTASQCIGGHPGIWIGVPGGLQISRVGKRRLVSSARAGWLPFAKRRKAPKKGLIQFL